VWGRGKNIFSGSDGHHPASLRRFCDSDDVYKQWRRQRTERSKGARSFRGQKIPQPGHPDALFFLKKVGDFLAVRSGNIFIFFSHYYRSKAIRRA